MLTKENRLWQWFAHAAMILGALACLFPLALLTVSSFTDEQTIIRNGYSFIPEQWSFAAYDYLWNKSSDIARAYGITLFITVIGTIGGVLICALLAYPLSVRQFRARNIFSFLVFFTLLFNGGLVPTYLVYTQLFGMKNTLLALIVPGLLMNGFNILLMRSYFLTSIPAPVLESATIDGAGQLRTFWSIVLPLSLPILATVGLFQVVLYWNDWFNGMVYVTDSKLFSLQNMLNRILTDIQFLSSNQIGARVGQSVAKMPSETVRMAIAVIGVVPLLIAYPFFQKYFVKGLIIGAVKG